MIKAFFLTLLIFSFNAFTKEIELNSENLWLYAMKLKSDEELLSINSRVLAEEFSNDYIVARKNPEKLKQLEDNKLKELKLKISKLPDVMKVKYSPRVRINSLDIENGRLNLTKVINTPYLDIETGKFINDSSESRLRVLLPNYPALMHIDFDKNQQKIVQKLQNNFQNKVELTWELEVVLAEFQNKREFQGVIQKAKLYSSNNVLIHQYSEDKTHKEVIDSSNFPLGFSLNLPPIHSFAFRGIRIQEHLIEDAVIPKNCVKTPLYMQHQPTICHYNYFANLDIIETYLGGQTVQIDMLARGKLNKKDKKELANLLMKQFSFNRSMFNKDLHKWDDIGIDFEVYTTVFFDEPTNYESKIYPDLNDKNLYKVVQIKSKLAEELLKSK